MSKWEELTPEQRMEIERKRVDEEVPETGARGSWVGKPTPQEEKKEREDRVFKEGILHTPPGTTVQTPAEATQETPDQPVNQRPTP